ncbi:trihelix transcription factor ASIL2-like [Abrus precatorius]|uniref:Trihelix transcription factor ASIL2-like n=1 Tax=Abrus precatorius TaxID=3816 RepID=A0A8B8LIX8_ABRPR|nr:trihelix transcription factor ASIL2-like [Abrus precatorius]
MEEKEETKEDDNINNNEASSLPKEESVRKGFCGERVKRDEWSEGAVSTLLSAYEAKWVLRNRAKLKGHDWEDVARHVSSRANCTKSPKTSTQCKNKVESMKKRYRSESASADHASSWPLYSRLDLLLRGTGPVTPVTAVPPPSQSPFDPSPPPLLSPPPPLAAASAPIANAQNSPGSNGVDKIPKEDGLATKSCDDESNKNALDTDSSTPALYSKKEELRSNKRKKKTVDNNGRRRKEYVEIAKSLRWLAEAMVRSEQARMDTVKEIERMRVEAEAKRGEMDLKRTEIIANTQLEIARIFASVNKGSVDSSLRIGRS